MKSLVYDSKTIILLIIVCLCALCLSATAIAQETAAYEINPATDTHFLAKKTRITNVTKWAEDGLSGVVAFGEKWVVVSSYRFASVVCTPTLVDIEGNPITLSSLKTGQWIRVEGFNHKGMIIGQKIVLHAKLDEIERPALEPLELIP